MEKINQEDNKIRKPESIAKEPKKCQKVFANFVKLKDTGGA